MINPSWFAYQEMDSEQIQIRFELFYWFDNRTHSVIDVQLFSIIEPNRMIGVWLGSIKFWFDFVWLDMLGKKEGAVNN